MNVHGYIQATLAAFFVITLSSCGGGGDEDSQVAIGIGGTGITASGTIDGFGSIFVNGVEFETDSASVVLDSSAAGEADLRLGMVVSVSGTVEQNGLVGTANHIEFDDEVQGPITAITLGADDTTKTLTVFGVSVFVDQTATTFDDVTYGTLALNDVIEVSGFFDSATLLRATRIEKKEDFVAGVSEIEVKGVVAGLTDELFMLGALTIDYSTADLSNVSGGGLAVGMNVEVKGTLSGTHVSATDIETEEGPFDADEDHVSLEGIITDFIDAGNFTVAGQAINAANAELEPANLLLQNGLQVELEGAMVNGVLIADEVEARSGEVKLSATVQSLDVANGVGTVTLEFAAGTVSFSIDNKTELGDETDTFDPLQLADIRAGDFLTVKALINGDQIIATEVRLEHPNQEKVRGPVDSFISNSEITLLGLTFSTAGAEFEDDNNNSVSSTTFYSQLSNGAIVEVEDDLPADGVADEVELKD
jgi:Domain of unknown function (DUF5666)